MIVWMGKCQLIESFSQPADSFLSSLFFFSCKTFPLPKIYYRKKILVRLGINPNQIDVFCQVDEETNERVIVGRMNETPFCSTDY